MQVYTDLLEEVELFLDEVKEYLRITDEDEDKELINYIIVAQAYIDECCGTEYKNNINKLKLSKHLMKKIITSFYENKSTIIPANYVQDKMVGTIFEILANN